MKYSWRPDKRKPEGRLLELAQERHVQGVAELIAHHDIVIIANMRSGLRFGPSHRYQISRESQSSCLSRSRSTSLLSQSLGRLHGLGVTKRSSSQKRKANQDEGSIAKRSKPNGQLSQLSQFSQFSGASHGIEQKRKTSLVESNSETFDNRILRFKDSTIEQPVLR